MAWFNRVDVSDSLEEPSISPDTEPTMWEKLRSQSWFGWTVRGIAALVIIIVVLFGARAIHHHFQSNKTSGTNTPVVVHPGAVSVTENKPTTSSSTQGSSGSSSSNSATKTTPTQVPDTGPGDVMAVFAITTLIAGAIHYAVNLRRANQA